MPYSAQITGKDREIDETLAAIARRRKAISTMKAKPRGLDKEMEKLLAALAKVKAARVRLMVCQNLANK